jgi:hypothetical protein
MDSELLLRLGNRTDVTASMRGHFIDDAYRRVAYDYDHKQLDETVDLYIPSGDDRQPQPDDMWFPVQLKNLITGRLIRPTDKDWIDSMQKASGDPHQFYWWKDEFVFDTYARVDMHTQLKYKKNPVALEAGDVSVLDELYDMLIILKAAQIGFETVRDWEAAKSLAGLYSKYEVDNGLMPVDKEKLNTWQSRIKVRTK